MRRRVHRRIVAHFDAWDLDGLRIGVDEVIDIVVAEGGTIVTEEIVGHPCEWVPEPMRASLSAMAFGDQISHRRFEVRSLGRRYVSDGRAMFLAEPDPGQSLLADRVIEEWSVDVVETLDVGPLTLAEIGKPNEHNGVLIGRTLVDLDYIEAAMLLYPNRGKWQSFRTGRKEYFDAVRLLDGPVPLAIIMGQRPI